MFKKNSDQTGKQSFSTVFSFCSIFLPLDCRQNKAFAIQYWQKRALFVLKKKKNYIYTGYFTKTKATETHASTCKARDTMGQIYSRNTVFCIYLYTLQGESLFFMEFSLSSLQVVQICLANNA